MNRLSTVPAHVHAYDVSRAQEFLKEACARASDAWIPSDAIADALLLELSERIEHHPAKERLLRLV